MVRKLGRKMKDSGIEWIGEIPEGWKVVKLKHIGVFTASGIDKKIKEDEVKIKIVNFVDVFNSKTKLISNDSYMEVTTTEDKKKEHDLKKGDMLFIPSSETAEEIGYSVVVNEDLKNTSYSYHVLRYRFIKKVLHEYKRFMFNNDFLLKQFSKRARGTTRQTLNRLDFKDSVVIIPPHFQQKSIADFLDRKALEIDNIISKTKEVIEEYKKYKQSLITEVVTKGLNKNITMKDSGIEWIGEIPEHWEVIRLGFLGRLQNGINKAGEEFGFGYPFINYGDIYRNYELNQSKFSGLVNSTEKHNLLMIGIQKKSVFTLTLDF